MSSSKFYCSMKITKHQFLVSNPIKNSDKILILGTIHPHDVNSFKLPFFYGNRNSLWNIFREVFPEELAPDFTIDDIKKLLSKRNIALSDTILECHRLNDSALDKDLIPIQLNMDLIDQIKDSSINQIYCTSGFGKNNAFRLFYESILGLKINKEIKQAKSAILPYDLFGRTIRVSLLPSPSGAANIALSQSSGYRLSKYCHSSSKRPVYDYKVSLYREIFGSL